MSKIDPTKLGQAIHSKEQPLRKEYELLYCFQEIIHCKTSQKFLKDKKHRLNFLDSLLFITKYFTDNNKDTLRGANAPKDFKQVTGNIEGYGYRFKIDNKNRVLCEEELQENKLILKLGKIGDFHK